MRSASLQRETSETAVSISLDVTQWTPSRITTGIRMLDHLLEQWAFHGRCSLDIEAHSRDGLMHHLVEDTAIVLGRTLDAALEDRVGIERYACSVVAMDDALVRCALDLGGRSYARIGMPIARERIEDLDVDLVMHFLTSFAQNARMTLHVDRLEGTDPHHVVEAAFKALARACRAAWSVDPTAPRVASTKGVLV